MTATMRVVALVAAPSDAPPFDAAAANASLDSAMRAVTTQKLVALDTVAEATENALRKRLAESPAHVFHFAGHGRSQQSAQYGTLVFQDSAGRARGLNGPYIATLLKSQPALRVVFLQACDDGDDPLGQVASALAAQGLFVVTSQATSREILVTFTRAFYAALAAGEAADAAFGHAHEALVVAGHAAARSGFRMRGRDPGARATSLAADAAATAPPAHPPDPFVEPEHARTAHAVDDDAFAQEIRRKRAAGAFDVFLCHNWADKPAVKRIAVDLKERGILPWLDEWELPPGQPWQRLLEQQIGSIGTAAVFVGAAGIGPWQEQELYGFLREFVSRRSPVIPVCLMDAPDKPELPIFLRAMTWVDFRLSDPDPMERLVWGITGKRAAD